jgi:hypothetical protein
LTRPKGRKCQRATCGLYGTPEHAHSSAASGSASLAAMHALHCWLSRPACRLPRRRYHPISRPLQPPLSTFSLLEVRHIAPGWLPALPRTVMKAREPLILYPYLFACTRCTMRGRYVIVYPHFLPLMAITIFCPYCPPARTHPHDAAFTSVHFTCSFYILSLYNLVYTRSALSKPAPTRPIHGTRTQDSSDFRSPRACLPLHHRILRLPCLPNYPWMAM